MRWAESTRALFSREWSAFIVSLFFGKSSALARPFSWENWGDHLPPAAQVQPLLRQWRDWVRGDRRWRKLRSCSSLFLERIVAIICPPRLGSSRCWGSEETEFAAIADGACVARRACALCSRGNGVHSLWAFSLGKAPLLLVPFLERIGAIICPPRLGSSRCWGSEETEFAAIADGACVTSSSIEGRRERAHVPMPRGTLASQKKNNLSVLGFLSFKRVILLKPPLFRAPFLAVKGGRLWGASLTASGVECSQAEATTLKSSPTRIECARLPLVKRVLLLKPPLSRAPSLAVSRLWGASLTVFGVECSQASSRSRESSCWGLHS